MSIKGRTILVTRRREQSGELIQGLERRGARVLLFPLIAITAPSSWEQCDTAIGRLGDYSGLFFTSTNAVEMFVTRVQLTPDAFSLLSEAALYAVGARTRDALVRYGLPVLSVPASFSGSELGKEMARVDLRGKVFLHPRGNLGRGDTALALRQAGAVVEEVEVYRTTEPDPAEWTGVRRVIESGEIDAIVFASPSAVESYVRLFPPAEFSLLRRKPRIAVIGPTTAEAAANRSLPVDAVAGESSSQGLIRVLEEILRT